MRRMVGGHHLSECSHTDEEIREMAYQVWLEDQRLLIQEALDAE
jgi:hypothetical protein